MEAGSHLAIIARLRIGRARFARVAHDTLAVVVLDVIAGHTRDAASEARLGVAAKGALVAQTG